MVTAASVAISHAECALCTDTWDLVICDILFVDYRYTGQYLADAVLQRPAELELAFVWNRSTDKMKGKVPEDAILADLDAFEAR